ncbi:hypothetical protein EDD29_7602 [Actinocorallia herbida]|uniref:Uncharacterized protein n=1 Tax=Actinocorallia herbida TaxID=58109 RepID=A0A3N1D8N1_9ACTN|nr:hypothetical protein [Actinocorallia herbida]ROO89892.1 hypothetical protein EDD29_7602 [Actinocorallia herbida]
MKGPGIRVLSVFALTAGLVALPTAAQAAGPRIDLKVLVVTDGSSPSVAAMAAQLDSEGVPYDLVDLSAPGRPAITRAFLQDTVGGAARAKYQGVVLPNAAPFGDAAEMTALAEFERQFGVRQISSYVYPTPDVGLDYPSSAGELDGTTAELTATAKAGAFRYLKGGVPFENLAPSVPETYGYPATPLPDAAGAHFEPYLTSGGKTLAGVYSSGTRSQMVLTFSANQYQTQFRALGHGLVTWLTKGVHLGINRQYFSVHVDDVFARDARWSGDQNCTPGENCTDPSVTTPDIRMTPADVTAAVDWQAQRAFPLDLYFNGGTSKEIVANEGGDPLLTAFKQQRTKFRWANHTLDHTYLGCEQDFTVSPWACKKDAQGKPVWQTRAYLKAQIADNRTWAAGQGFALQADELVTGEHSGLKILPQQPEDNPNLALAAADTGVKWLGSDASRDFDQRAVGAALTVPRYPMANYFNVGTAAEMADEYNWIYTSRADGGSGICEDNPQIMTCIDPLDPATGYLGHIVPLDARITLAHILRNDPRPHYVHQSNMAEERILYPLLDRVLADYGALFAANSPLVNQRMRDNGAELKRQAAWRAASKQVTAYLQDGKVKVSGAPSGVQVPVTVPEGTRTGLLNLVVFGEKYAGERSAYQTGAVTLTVGAATV